MFTNIPSFSWKSPVATASDLPVFGNSDGDVRVVLSDDSLRIWDEGSSTWVIVSGGTGLTSLNGLTASNQTFATAATGTDFTINSSGSVHTFAIPNASATARGLISTGTQTFAGDKTFTGLTTISYSPVAADWLTAPSDVIGALNTIKAGDFSSSITLNDNTSAAAFNFSDTNRYAVINYSISRNGAYRVGRLLIAHNSVTVSISDDFLETATTGVTFSASLGLGLVTVSYTTTLTTFNAFLKYNILKWV